MMWRERLQQGLVIPAHPLALTAERKLDERRQRALTRYYLAAGAGGVAVGVHTTQFQIREPQYSLFKPVLQLAMEEMRGTDAIAIAGICGATAQAVAEAEFAAATGYHAGLLSLAALREASVDQWIDHARAVGAIIPIIGFYLQPAVGGCVLPYAFWRRFAALDCVIGIKVAPFNRYQTLDVLRGVADSGRAGKIALYTGNDDNIVGDLITPYHYQRKTLRFVGGLLGHWAVWTRRAVELLAAIRMGETGGPARRAYEITDTNAAFFDSANGFRGCIAGIHEVLRRQGLLAGRWCLDPSEDLSPGQNEEISRVYSAYPHLNDDEFVAANLDLWLK
jgi:dihydrodipicolinate synthase/N-acetylneuraminate lyase